MNRNSLAYLSLMLLAMITITPVIAGNIGQPTMAKQTETTVNIGIIVDNSTAVTQDELTNFKNYLDNLPWANVKFIDNIQSYSDIATNDIIIMLGAITFENISEYLNSFIIEGGSLLITPPAANLDKFNNFTKSIGFEALESIAEDNSSYYETNTTLELINTWDAKSPIFNGITKILLPSAHPIRISVQNITYKGDRYTLLWGYNTTVAGELKGENVTMIAAAELFTTSKVVVVGTYSIFTNTHINLGDNRILAINIVKWLGNRFDSLKIQDISVSNKEVNVNINPLVQINFTITNSSGSPIQAVATVLVVRAGSTSPLIEVNASYLGNGKYTVKLNFTGFKASIVELWIIAHKKYVGYYIWPNPNEQRYEITIYSLEPYQIIPDPLTAVFFVAIPILGFILITIRMLPRYLKNRRKIRELEKKQETK